MNEDGASVQIEQIPGVVAPHTAGAETAPELADGPRPGRGAEVIVRVAGAHRQRAHLRAILHDVHLLLVLIHDREAAAEI